MIDRDESNSAPDVTAVETDAEAVANRRKAIGRIVALAAAAPIAALLFKPGAASASTA